MLLGIAAERKEAKQEKDEAEKYKKLREDFMTSRLHTMLFRLFYNDKEIDEIKEESEVTLKFCISLQPKKSTKSVLQSTNFNFFPFT